ncbi:MAG TPA: tetratricopeptide repeat protein [Phycisphaerae bacterium]|nr:tetratricopeptide repeat protein [Phycisphaerae bacterium]
MSTSILKSRLLRLGIVLLVAGILAGGGYVAHKYRKRAALEASLAKGLEAYKARQYTTAATELGRYLTAHRDNLDILFKYADAQLSRRPQSRGALDQAVAALETILRQQPGHAQAAEKLSGLYLLMRSPIEAERIARAWVEADPNNPVAKRQLATVLAAQRKPTEALALIRQVVAEKPQDPRAPEIFMRLVASQGASDAEAATTEPVTQPESGSPESPSAETQPAAPTSTKLALREMEDLVVRHPDAAGVRIAIAKLYRMFPDLPIRSPQQHLALAVEHLDRAEKCPDLNAELWVEIAQVWADMGIWDRSAAAFDRAEQLEPHNIDIYNARALIVFQAEDYAATATIADRALKAPVGEMRADILPLAAEAYARTNRVADARKCIEDLRANNTESHMLSYLEAIIDLVEGRLTKAIDGFEDAVRRQPRFSMAQLALARARMANGEFERALTPLREYVRLVNENRATITPGELDLAMLYAQLGRWDEALSVAANAYNRARGRWLNEQALLTFLRIQANIARPGGHKPDPAVMAQLQQEIGRIMQKPGAAESRRWRVLQAQINAWNGQVDEAVESLKALRESEAAPQKARITNQLIDILAQAGRLDDAIAECTLALESADAEARPELERKRSGLLLARGNPDQALEELSKAAEQATGEARTQLRLQVAELMLSQRRHSDACNLLEQIAREDRQSLLARKLLLGMPQDIAPKLDRQKLVDEMKEIEGENGLEWRYRQAALWLGSPDWQSHQAEIEKLLKECIVGNPSWFDAMAALVSLHERQGTAKARETVQELIARQSTDDTTRVRLRLILIELATKAADWATVDAELNALPVRLEDPDLDRMARGLRLDRAFRNRNQTEARAMLEEQVKDPTEVRSRLILAQSLLAQSDGNPAANERATQLIEEAATIAPDDLGVLSARVGLLTRLEHFDEAIALCDQAEAKKQAEAILLRSRIWEQRGDLDKALADLERYATQEGKAEAGFLALGRFHYRYNRIEEAMHAWRSGLQVAPNSVELRGALTEVLLASGDPKQREEALAIIEQRLAEDPNDNNFKLLRADYLLATNPEEAALLYEKIIETTPTAAKAFANLAQLRWLRSMKREPVSGKLTDEQRSKRAEEIRRQQAEAVAIINRGIAANPNNPALLLTKADMLMNTNPVEAASAARLAAELLPDDEPTVLKVAQALERSGAPTEAIRTLQSFLGRATAEKAFDARITLARLLVQSRQFSQAEDVLKQADALRPDNAATSAVRLMALAGNQRGRELIELANQWLEKAPNDFGVAQLAGELLLGLQDPQFKREAIRFFEYVVSKNEDSAEALGALGLAWYQNGEIEKARASLEDAHKRNPKNHSILNNLTWIVCEDQKDPAAAEKLAGPAIRDGADHPSLWDTWGMVLYRLGRLSEAAEAFQNALDHPEASPDTKHSAMFHLARTLEPSDRQRSLALLNELFSAPADEVHLSPSEKQEAEELRERLRTSPDSAAATGDRASAE